MKRDLLTGHVGCRYNEPTTVSAFANMNPKSLRARLGIGTKLRKLRYALLPRADVPNLPTVSFQSYDEHEAYLWRDSVEIVARLAEESRLVPARTGQSIRGFCYVCRGMRSFAVSISAATGRPNWRETLTCETCGLWTRVRAALQVIETDLHLGPNSTVYITEQCTPLFGHLKSKYRNLIGSEFLGDDVSPGSLNANGVRHEDLTNLSFGDESFDYILSFDVFEHVPEFRTAFEECFRCLKPGGVLAFSVPFVASSRSIIVRATVDVDGRIHHLLPPETHGDPVRFEGSLCFYHYGWQLLDMLRSIGYIDVRALSCWSRELCVIGGGEQLMFVAGKP